MRFRSLLYVPVSADRFVAKAHERGADAIILDLEDAVAPAQKAPARAKLADAVKAVGRKGATVFVRINADVDMIRADADAACRAGAFGLLVPKVHRRPQPLSLAGFLDGIEHLCERVPIRLVPMIEDPAAVLDARKIVAATPRVCALMTGGEDLATALGAEPTPEVLHFPKLMVHFAAKAAGVLSLGLMRTVADYDDLNGDGEVRPRGANVRVRRRELRPSFGGADPQPRFLAERGRARPRPPPDRRLRGGRSGGPRRLRLRGQDGRRAGGAARPRADRAGVNAARYRSSSGMSKSCQPGTSATS